MSLYWYSYYDLRTENRTRKNDFPGLDAWVSIYKAFQMILVDRRGTVRPPIATLADPYTRFPDVALYPVRNFEECCMLRAEELMRIAREKNVPIYILFSGGLDSTAVAVSFLKAFPVRTLKKHLKIVASSDAWVENPNFVRDHLVKNFEFISSRENCFINDGRALLVNGDSSEFGIFSSQKLAQIPESTPPSDAMFAYLAGCDIPEAHARLWTDVFLQEKSSAPVELPTFIDWLWWVRFSWTWQYTNYSGFGTAHEYSDAYKSLDEFHTYFLPFYNSPEFQVWAMRDNTDRGPRKPERRELIRSFTHDDQWTTEKKQYASFPLTKRYRKRLMAVDSDFRRTYDSADILKHYDPANDFT